MSTNGQPHIGQRIRERRHVLGLSQRELATTGVSYAYISRVEHGSRQPSVRALRRIAPRLGVSAHWLETGEHDPLERAEATIEILIGELNVHERMLRIVAPELNEHLIGVVRSVARKALAAEPPDVVVVEPTQHEGETDARTEVSTAHTRP